MCRLLAAVELFSIKYMMNYFLPLHIFQTTSVNARWGQPWLIQPQSFPKQVSNWMLLYAMFLQLKGWNLNQIWCFESSWLLFLVSWIPTKTWMWINSGYQLPSIFSNGESVWNFQRGKLCSLLMVNAEKRGAKTKWGRCQLAIA